MATSRRPLLVSFLLTACTMDHPGSAPTARRASPSVPRLEAAPEGAIAHLPAIARTVRFGPHGPRVTHESGREFSIQTHRVERGGTARHLMADPGEVLPCEGMLADRTGCASRLVYNRGHGIEEWWVGHRNGLQQGWTVASAGDEPGLAFVVEVSGSVSVDPNGLGAAVRLADGQRWRVGSVFAWDARGYALPARLWPAKGGRFQVVVDDSSAEYPIVVDPVYTTASGHVLGGEVAQLGSLLAGGDFNSDGYPDLVVSQTADSGAMALRVHYGDATGLPSAPDDAWVEYGDGTDQPTVLLVGDLNGDGVDDLVSVADGWVGVRYGGGDGLSDAYDDEANPSGTVDELLAVGAFLADVDGDGIDELVTKTRDSSSGANLDSLVYVDPTSSGLPSTYTVAGTHTGAWSGTLGGNAGDVDGDGFHDVVLDTMLVPGSSTGPDWSSAETLVISGSLHYYLSWIDRDLGDVNGDGYGDFLGVSSGGIAVYHGASSMVGESQATDLTMATASYYFGRQAHSLGDLDADGYDDVVIVDSGDGAGQVYIYFGTSTGLQSSPGQTLAGGGTSGDHFGWKVVTGHDFSGDGIADLAISEPYSDDDVGNVYVYAGSTSATFSHHQTLASPEGLDDVSASSLAMLEDVNGDGYGDLVVGRPNASVGGVAHQGRAYLHLGSPSGIDLFADQTLEPPTGSFMATSLASGGDLDADGYTDLLLTSYSNPLVAYGSSTGFVATGPTTLSHTGSQFISTDGGGDLDGDGYDDALFLSYSSSSTDKVFVALGSSTGARSALMKANATIGTSNDVVASLGDVNNDGYDDFAWGINHRYVYVYHGDATGSYTRAQSISSTHCAFGRYWYYGKPSLTGADVDGDGYSDIIGMGSNCWFVAYGAATGVASSPDLETTGVSVAALVSGDVDDDGFADILIDDGYGIMLVRGFGAGPTSVGYIDDTTVPGTSNLGAPLATGADLNGDGYNDLAAADDGLVAIFNGYRDDDDDGVLSVVDCDDDDATVGASGVDMYADADGDGYGDATSSATLCGATTGYSSNGNDCDDTDATIHPGATEVAGDGIDMDCDGTELCYVDADDDGYRPDATSTTASTDIDCDDTGEAYSTEPVDDCDDDDASSSPVGVEVPEDGIDQDCDGSDTCIVDADDDGYVADATLLVATSDSDCTDAGEAQTTDPTGDCDDDDATIHPGAIELPGDGVDQDCDTFELCFIDADDDGYRPDDGTTTSSANVDCLDVGLATASTPAGDCDDADAAFSPAATELVGDAVDQDCDGGELCFEDADGDGFRPDGDASVGSTDPDCSDPGEALATAPTGDCDDSDSTVAPGLDEIAGDERDQNCDGREVCYADSDNDGYRSGDEADVRASSDLDCLDAQEASESTPTGDCDDSDASVHPAAVETVGNEVDDDCDGAELCYVDNDSDGHTPDLDTSVTSSDSDCTDAGEATADHPTGDCDDSDADIVPGAAEIPGDEIDQNCDGSEDCYVDADEDGAPVDASTVVASDDLDCADAGEAAAPLRSLDCDDADPTSHPGADEIAGDGVDQDCDGSDTPADAAPPSGDDGGKTGCATPSPTAAPGWLLAGLLLVPLARRSTRQPPAGMPGRSSPGLSQRSRM